MTRRGVRPRRAKRSAVRRAGRLGDFVHRRAGAFAAGGRRARLGIRPGRAVVQLESPGSAGPRLRVGMSGPRGTWPLLEAWQPGRTGPEFVLPGFESHESPVGAASLPGRPRPVRQKAIAHRVQPRDQRVDVFFESEVEPVHRRTPAGGGENDPADQLCKGGSKSAAEARRWHGLRIGPSPALTPQQTAAPDGAESDKRFRRERARGPEPKNPEEPPSDPRRSPGLLAREMAEPRRRGSRLQAR